jgi:hypothetical protein
MVEIITALAGGGLSLALSYTPRLSERFELLSKKEKQFVLLVSWAVAAALVMLFGCVGLFSEVAAECSKNGLEDLVRALLIVASSSQFVYVFTDKDKN